MKREELLTKLAMELAEWPGNIDQRSAMYSLIPSGWLWDSGFTGSTCLVKKNNAGIAQICESHWLQRRTELINCPPDSEAPEWAEWKAQDSNGHWFWHEECPIEGGSLFQHSESYVKIKMASRGKIPAGHDWRTTLIRVNQKTDECTPEEDAAWSELGERINAPNDPAKHYSHHYDGIKLDPYRIAKVYNVQGGPREQILKKVLRFTDKGHTEQQVINEVRSALNRWQEMLDEDSED